MSGARVDARTFVASALRDHARSAGVLVVSVPAPVTAPEAALQSLERCVSTGPHDGGAAVLWCPGEGARCAGVGAAWRFELRGERRLDALRQARRALGERLVHVVHPGCDAPPPRLFGGMAFAAGAARPPWTAFGDGSFVLPRWCWSVDDAGARLSLAVDLQQAERLGAARLEAELDTLLHVLAASPSTSLTASTVPRSVAEQDAPEPWQRQLRSVARAIEAGRVAKVVVARRASLRAARSFEPLAIARRLGAWYPSCTRFALRRGDGWFIGASPERLFAKQGQTLRTEAMAGSARTGEAAALRDSEKDRREHGLVVDGIVQALGPLSHRIERAPTPQVRALPNVLHLHTPIRAELHGDVDAVSVLQALHPTAAVCGVPASRAMEWIRRHELAERGWYSGPVGWMDVSGDAELAVALRSGLVRERQAWLWAGAGIVAGSDPHAEYEETLLKMRPMLDALGAVEERRGAEELESRVGR